MVPRSLIALLLGLSSLVPGVVSAQSCDPSEDDLEQARALFIAGGAAVDAGRWSDAINSFERAYALSCAPSALYNLAMAYRALGRHREARDQFARLLRQHPDLGGELSRSATTFAREEGARVAVLELVGIDPDLHPEISFDGRLVPDEGTRPIRLETDAGPHGLVARIDQHQPFLWEGALADGQTEQVQVRFEAIVSGGGLDPLVVILPIIAGALVIGGIVAGVVVQNDAQLPPHAPGRTVTIQGGS